MHVELEHQDVGNTQCVSVTDRIVQTILTSGRLLQYEHYLLSR